MYLGQCVEKAPVDELFDNPVHPYTQALLKAIPVPNLKSRNMQNILSGEVTSPIDPKPGCRFAARCPHASSECTHGELQLNEISPNHFVSCAKFGK